MEGLEEEVEKTRVFLEKFLGCVDEGCTLPRVVAVSMEREWQVGVKY